MAGDKDTRARPAVEEPIARGTHEDDVNFLAHEAVHGPAELVVRQVTVAVYGDVVPRDITKIPETLEKGFAVRREVQLGGPAATCPITGSFPANCASADRSGANKARTSARAPRCIINIQLRSARCRPSPPEALPISR